MDSGEKLLFRAVIPAEGGVSDERLGLAISRHLVSKEMSICSLYEWEYCLSRRGEAL